MEAKNILHAEWLDILFEGRNKFYGAYYLRKLYARNVVVAMVTTFCSVLLVFALLPSYESEVARVVEIPFDGNTLVSIRQQKVIPSKPRPVKKSASSSARDRYVKPLVENSDVESTEKINTLREGSAISTMADSGTRSPLVGMPIEDLPASNPVQGNHEQSAAPETVFIKTEIEAGFPGGTKAWKRYLERNLDASLAVKNGAPEGTYTVVVRFIVSTDGSISDVIAQTEHGYGMEQEAVKVVKRGPKWTPALQNGSYVKAYRSQPITFLVESQ